MIKRLIPLMLALMLIPISYAWLTCTPSSCPSGYSDGGTTCDGSACIRECHVNVCADAWTTEDSYSVTINNNQEIEWSESTSFESDNSSKCYNFSYVGPTATNTYVDVDVNTGAEDCDAEAIGGFWEGDTTHNGNSDPWFSSLNGYLGTTPDHYRFNYLLTAMRAHSSATPHYNQDYFDAVNAEKNIYCAPNSIACDYLGEGYLDDCDTGCYNEKTKLYVVQGSFGDDFGSTDTGSDDSDAYNQLVLYDYDSCTNDAASYNKIISATFKIQSTSLIYQYDNQSCDRGNEPPTAYNVTVKPENPTVGDDIYCYFDYVDEEGFEEQNSSYKWYKNSADQSINSQILGKGNLTTGDQWYCKVAPSDGLNTSSTFTQSTNTVAIASTVSNPKLYIEDTEAWNYPGYLSGDYWINYFSEELQAALATCTPDAEGYCNITIGFDSQTNGSINITELEVVYEENLPSTSSITITSPLSSQNVTQNEFFNYSAEVCCKGTNCGSINVSLDPIQEEYTYYSKKTCTQEGCTHHYFSSPRYGFEDNQWKPIEELRSFKGTIPIQCYIQSDGIHHVTCLDYNYTHKKLSITVDDFKEAVPMRTVIPELQANIVILKEDLDKRVEITKNVEAQWFASDYTSELHVGEESTIITYVPDQTNNFAGWWEATGGTLAIYNWSDCDANSYSAWDLSQISDNATGNIYGSGGGSSTQYSYCHRLQWEINESAAEIQKITSYARWTGSTHSGADSITKSLFIGNANTQTWELLDLVENAWSTVEHIGSVDANIADYIENSTLYTLLHYNATISGGATGTYSNLYYTELIITTGNATQNESGKGLISTTLGTTPFYTTSQNPTTISLNQNECQNVSWLVNATGVLDSAHTFFAYANLTSNLSISNMTNTIDITITEALPTPTNSTLLYNHTFESDTDGWGGSITQYSFYGGYIEATSDWATFYSGDLDLASLDQYRIEMIVWVNDSSYAKFYPNSQQYSATDPHFYYENNGATMSIKYYDGGYHTITGLAPLNANITWIIDVNRTGGCINATFNWGTAVSLSEQCGQNLTNDYVHWNTGDLNGYQRIMDFKVYNTS